ncbi:MAG: TIM barrel protein [Candidatus Hydrogenedentes bacterium]|nr:TIM barrel protein [Candidatus Hydrogenedentota bacterium]
MVESGYADALDNPLFAYKNSMEVDGPESIAEQVQILADIGLDGFDNRELENLAETLAELDKHGLKLYTSYFAVRIDPGEVPYNPGLAGALPLLKDHGTILWCNTHSKQFKPSDPAGDALAVPIFQEVADMAAPYGVKVAPYPHINLWVETPEDTLRLAEKVDRPNFGTSFNLYHWKVLGDRQRPIEEVAKALTPEMYVMSINGDEGPHDIGPLEAEDIDEYYTVLKAFLDQGYKGPVGLQSYLIPGDPRQNLGQSYSVWKQLQERFRNAPAAP